MGFLVLSVWFVSFNENENEIGKWRLCSAGFFPVCPKTGLSKHLQTTFTYVVPLLGLLHDKFLDQEWTKVNKVRQDICGSRCHLQIIYSLRKKKINLVG